MPNPVQDLKREAAGLRDRRDHEALRKVVDKVDKLEPGSSWVDQNRAICDASRAIEEKSKNADLALRISRHLKAAFEFALAARLLEFAWEAALAAQARDAVRLRLLGHELALCTYKDEERVPARRLQVALELLNRVRTETGGGDGETMRLTGAVFKRRWEINGELDDLLSARAAYLAAWERDPVEDDGYGAVNAAFLHDALAAVERVRARGLGLVRTGAAPGASIEGEARALRVATRELLLKNTKPDYWHLATLAEVHFGLGEYDDAAICLRAAAAASPPPSDWMVQTTAKQLAALFTHQHAGKESADAEGRKSAMSALRNLTQLSESSMHALSRGKVGLALSGGGFRASLFHLGVLARLAEMDVLRHVEAISTVSGGSIVGAQYYLKLKVMLESRPDGQLDCRDYVELVRQLIPEFLAGVRTNLRMQTLSNLIRNLQMMLGRFGKSYTRSTRLGDLYDRYFYQRAGRLAADGRTDALRMDELLIVPQGTPPGGAFSPKFENWRRDNRVPVLLLNATPLNTGHGWQFTARSMGEPPSLAADEIDSKPRYRRLYYSQAPTETLREFRLGHAVAASAGVPGLFEPIVLDGLYPDRSVRLVDGGVHDNQGIAGLLDEGCNFILCSDASGQMGEKSKPPGSTLPVLLRTNSVMMDRVREAQYLDLDARKQNRALNGLAFLHMKKDLAAPKLDWVECQDPSDSPPRPAPLPYGIDPDIQEMLANLRTDLDAFTDEEAAALMASGYLMTAQEFDRLDRVESQGSGRWGGFDIRAPRDDWPFLEAELLRLLAAAPGTSPQRDKLGARFGIGAEVFFKVFLLYRTAWTASAVLVGGALLWWQRDCLSNLLQAVLVRDLTVGGLVLWLIPVVLAALIPVLGWLRPENMLRQFATRLVLAFLGWLLCNLYLLALNPLFRWSGRLKGFYRK